MHALDDSPVYLYDTSTILRPGRLSPCKRQFSNNRRFLNGINACILDAHDLHGYARHVSFTRSLDFFGGAEGP